MVLGVKTSSKSKLFEQPLDKLFSPKAIKQLNNHDASMLLSSRSPLGASTSVPLSCASTWAKLSQENNLTKRKRTAARLRRFTIDANNNARLFSNITNLSASVSPTAAANSQDQDIQQQHQRLGNIIVDEKSTRHIQESVFNSMNNHTNQTGEPASNSSEAASDQRRQLLLSALPPPIRCLLNELYLRGPSTMGIFRKSPNAKHCRELRQKLETEGQTSIKQFQVNVIASVFKEWLRSLPDCLLMSRLYPQWIDVAKLIEPLHLHQQQQQQQQQHHHLNHQQLDAGSHNGGHIQVAGQRPGSDSDEDPLTSAASFCDNSSAQAARIDVSADNSEYHNHQHHFSQSPARTLTDNTAGARPSYRHANRYQRLRSGGQPLVRARSCSTMTSDEPTGDGSGAPPMLPSFGSTDLASGENQRQTAADGRPRTLSLSEFALRERHSECIRIVRQLLDTLNETNLILLRAIICVLWHIASNSDHNKMSSANLGVCIGQSLLNDEHQSQHFGSASASSGSYSSTLRFSASTFTKRHKRARSQCLLSSTLSLTNLTPNSPTYISANQQQQQQQQPQASLNSSLSSYFETSCAQECAKYVPMLVAFMIDNAKDLFDADIVNLFGRRPAEFQSLGGPAAEEASDEAAARRDEQQKTTEIIDCPEQKHQRYHQQAEHNSSSSLDSSGPSSNRTDSSLDNEQIHHDLAGRRMDESEFSDLIKAKIDRALSSELENDQHRSASGGDMVGDCKTVADTPGDDNDLRDQKAADDLRTNCRMSSFANIRQPVNYGYDQRDGIVVGRQPTGPQVTPRQPYQRHRRHPSSSQVLVHIGNVSKNHELEPSDAHNNLRNCDSSLENTTTAVADQAAGRRRESTCAGHDDRPNGTPNQANASPASTTSILIVQAPRKVIEHHHIYTGDRHDDQLHSSDDAFASNSSASCSPTSPTCDSGNSSRSDRREHLGSTDQRRPLSATESTGSSSRASSSTSGIHSESPSSDPDTNNRTSSRVSKETSSISSPVCSSLSVASSSCTSPVEIDVVDAANNLNRSDSGLDKNEVIVREEHLMQCDSGSSKLSVKNVDEDVIDGIASQYNRKQSQQHEVSQLCGLSLQAPTSLAANRPRSLMSIKESYQGYERATASGESTRSFAGQSQTLNRCTSSSHGHIVSLNRMPKIPFQYTTSNYGGEAVLYYPSYQHLMQRQQQQQQHDANGADPQQFNSLDARSDDCRSSLTPKKCNTNNCLSQHQPQQQQQPPRSNVMLLRDYYLSLQLQNQQQQQQLNLFRAQRQQQPHHHHHHHHQQQRSSVLNHKPHQISTTRHQIQRASTINCSDLQNEHLHPVSIQRQQQMHPAQRHSLTVVQQAISNFHIDQQRQSAELSHLQQQPAAVTYQRAKPRMAKIRPNQFNGLYVKQTDASLVNALVKNANSTKDQVTAAASGTLKVAQSLSQQSSQVSSSVEHSSSDESDESNGEWAESTMV